MEEIRTFGDILDEIIDVAKLQNTTEVRDSLKRKVNTCYQEICFEESYRWTGETRSMVLESAYTAGTVSVTQGSDQAVGTTTVWTENDHLFLKIKVSGAVGPFTIIRVDEVNQILTLDSPWVKDNSALAGYSIYKDEYGLFPDLQDVRTFSIPGVGNQRQPQPCGVIEMDSMRARSPFRSGLPIRYTINGFSYFHERTWADFRVDTDYWEDDTNVQPRNRKLIIFPAIFTQDRVATLRFTRVVDGMDSDTDEPLIPYENRSVLVYGTLVKNFLKQRDIQITNAWMREYAILKTKMAADIETTDDDLMLYVDQRNARFEASTASDITTAPWER